MIPSSLEQTAPFERSFFSFPTAAKGNRFWQIAIVCISLICFLEVSRLHEFMIKAHIISILSGLLAVSLLASRRAGVFWKCHAGKVLPFFSAWVLLAYFAAPRTSFGWFYTHSVLEGTLFFIGVAGLFCHVSDFRKLFAVLTAAAFFLCSLGVVYSGIRNGRFALRHGAYADPNDFAMALLATAPVIWATFASKPLWMKLCAIFGSALPLLLAARTASRGGFMAMLAMLIVIFFLSSFKTRIVMATTAVLALVLVLAFLPDSLRTRLTGAARLSTQGESQEDHDRAAASVDARETLLMTSVNLTLAYPFLGVGPGNFAPTIVEFGRLQGFNWVEVNTHNSYTQLSSETGIPGLLLYLAFLFFSLKSLLRVLRRTSPRGDYADPPLHRMAAGLLVSIAATLTCMFFLSEGYGVLIFIWLGAANGLALLLPPDPDEEEDEYIEVQPGQAA